MGVIFQSAKEKKNHRQLRSFSSNSNIIQVLEKTQKSFQTIEFSNHALTKRYVKECISASRKVNPTMNKWNLK